MEEKVGEKSVELFPGYKEFKLEDYPVTEPGWDLLKILLDEVREPVQHVVPTTTDRNGYVQTTTVTRHVRLKKHRYLFGRSHDNTIAAYGEKLRQAFDRWREVRNEADKVKDDLKEAQRCVSDYATKIQQQSESSASLRRQLDRAEQTNHKMEATIAKLRASLGTIRFDEITKE